MKQMNKIIYIAILAFSIFFSCKNEKSNKIGKKTIPNDRISKSAEIFQDNTISKLDSLKFYFKKISTNQVSVKDFKKYNEYFPSNFDEFVSYFGFDDKKGIKMPLYDNANEYIELLFSNKNIEMNYRYNKVINIAKNGKWEADAVNYFKHQIINIFNTNAANFINVLSKKDLQTQTSFWFFYFDSPHPPKKISKKLLLLLNDDENMLKALKKGFQKTSQSAGH